MTITNTSATNKTQITCDFPDFASGSIIATLRSRVAINDDYETFPGQTYTCTLDSSGNVASATHPTGWFLPTYDTTGTVTYHWQFEARNSGATVKRHLGGAFIGYDASAQALGSLLSGTTETSVTYANISTATATWLEAEKTATEAAGDGYLLQSDGDNSEDSGITAASVSTAITQAGGALQTTGGTMSGTLAMADNLITRPKFTDYGETVNAIGSIGGGTQDIDITSGNVVSGTVDTSTTTFTFSNPSASGTACSFTLFLTNGGSQTVNWPASVDWAGGTAPTLTSSGVDILTFVTLDGGTIWYGFAAGLDMQ